MNCNEVKKYLYAFLDNELTVAQNVEILYHMEHCKHCASTHAEERDYTRALRDSGQKENAPNALKTRLAAACGPKGAQFRHQNQLASRRLQVLASVAASIFLVAGILYVFLNQPLKPVNAVSVDELAQSLTNSHNARLNNALKIKDCDCPVMLSEWMREETRDDPKLRKLKMPNACILGYKQEGGCKTSLCKGYSTCLIGYDLDGRKLTLCCFAVDGIKNDDLSKTKVLHKDVYVKEVDGLTVVIWKNGESYESLVGQMSKSEALNYTEALLLAD